ncbi:MAG TPA: hypothetical protein VK590_15510 [Saprospiraceae bacterium]|nr:hypothetical protein [Saprospiraceae bacterium]
MIFTICYYSSKLIKEYLVHMVKIEATGVKLAWSLSGMMCSHTEAQTQIFH